MNSTFDEPIIEDKLPVFLKVLCILTFVGCGLSLLTSLYGIAMGPNAQKLVNDLQKQREVFPGMVDGMRTHIPQMNTWMTYLNYVTLLNVLMCLGGALLMWKQKKTGFFLYTTGQIILIAVGIGYCLIMKDIPFMGMITIVSQILNIVIIAAFIIMYSANLKHMR